MRLKYSNIITLPDTFYQTPNIEVFLFERGWSRPDNFRRKSGESRLSVYQCISSPMSVTCYERYCRHVTKALCLFRKGVFVVSRAKADFKFVNFVASACHVQWTIPQTRNEGSVFIHE